MAESGLPNDLEAWVVERLKSQGSQPSPREIIDEMAKAFCFFQVYLSRGLPAEKVLQAYDCPAMQFALESGISLTSEEMDKLLGIRHTAKPSQRV